MTTLPAILTDVSYDKLYERGVKKIVIEQENKMIQGEELIGCYITKNFTTNVRTISWEDGRELVTKNQLRIYSRDPDNPTLSTIHFY